MDHLYLYGPPLSGKSSVGKKLAEQLGLPFIDLDKEITTQGRKSIPEIFVSEGEDEFRRRELAALREVSTRSTSVVALGGGALLAGEARAVAESSGQVICLSCSLEGLLERVGPEDDSRPLLAGDSRLRLENLLTARKEHYLSFPFRVDTTDITVDEAVWKVQVSAGRFIVRGMGQEYPVVVQSGGLAELGPRMKQAGLKGPVALVCDENTAEVYEEPAKISLESAGYAVFSVTIRAGEAYKNVETISALWAGFAGAHLERGSTVVALGGGVVGDQAGFAAATFLRGISWVNVPTTLLAMVDSSLGGKTGFDLPQGKNLVGAFHAPLLVLADPNVLKTLPEAEFRSGLAETIKHGIIGDPELFAWCEQGVEAVRSDLTGLVRRGMAVKVKVIEVDPYEKGIRQSLNLGHTVGHGVELASGFTLSHGESVAIGMVIAARISEQMGIAEEGLAERICNAVARLGLPTEIPSTLSKEQIIAAMLLDKKRVSGKVRFALPERIGSVRVGVEVENWQEYLNH